MSKEITKLKKKADRRDMPTRINHGWHCPKCGNLKGDPRSKHCWDCRIKRNGSTAGTWKMSDSQKESLKKRVGAANPNWKGDNVKFNGLHRWVERHKGKPTDCTTCHKEGWLDLANISQEYKRDFNDWEWLCRKCHMTKDGRLVKLVARNQSLN